MTIGPTRKPGFDLIEIVGMKKLKRLAICGHAKNIQILGQLQGLEDLFLSMIPNTVGLEFVNQLSKLRKLTFILGGRSNINEIKHSGISELEITRVRGFSSFEPADFIGLTTLKIEDQIQLDSLKFKKANKNISELGIHNCKKLKKLEGLQNLPALRKIRISGTTLPFDELLKNGLPPKLKIYSFCTWRSREDKIIRKKLDDLGLKEFDEKPG